MYTTKTLLVVVHVVLPYSAYILFLAASSALWGSSVLFYEMVVR